MRKIFTNIIIFSAVIGLVVVNYSLSGIKFAQGCVGVQMEYVPTVNTSGEFTSQGKTDIILSYPVYVDEVFVTENRTVSKGQALFSIDKEKMIELMGADKQEQSEALSGFSYEEITSASAVTDYSRSGLYALPDIVYSPDDGYISRLNIYDGCIMLSGKPLLSVSKTDDIVAKFTLSQMDYGKISVGDKVNITSVAFDDAEYIGKISGQSAVVRKQTTAMGSKVVVDVFATLDNPDSRVSSGFQVNARIESGRPMSIFAVEYKYIHQDDKGEYVLVLNNGTASKVYITTGVEAQDYTQIIGDFDEDTVFLYGDIQEGDRVILSR